MLWSGSFAHASDGMVKSAQGDVFIIRKENRLRADVGVTLEAHDIIETEANGAIGITLKDSTRLSLGPNSQFVLEEFVFQPEEKQFSLVAKVLSGTLFFNTGKIGKIAPENIRLLTPKGTIGVRGTSLLIEVPKK